MKAARREIEPDLLRVVATGLSRDSTDLLIELLDLDLPPRVGVMFVFETN